MTVALSARRAILTPQWVKRQLWKAAREVPSWHIAPALIGDLTDLVAGQSLVTFTNSSPAWGFNRSGILVQPTANVPFIEYDPATGSALGWRVWDAVTNLITRSEEFEGTGWSKYDTLSVTANQALSPSGALTADLFTCGALLGYMQASGASVSFVSGQVYTFSVFLKAGTATKVVTLLYSDYFGVGGSNVVATWNLSSGTATLAGGLSASVSMQNCGNGWYRCALTATATATGAGPQQYIRAFTLNSNFYAWGAQLNTGILAPYVPTGALTASSTADVASILSWAAANNIRSAYIRGRTTASGTRGLLSGNDNSSSNRIEAITSGTDPRLQVTTSGSSVADIDGGTIAANTTFRMAMRFAPNDFALSVNGGAVVTDTSGALPTIDRWFLGRTQAGEYGNCYIEELALFTNGLSDSRLTAMGGV